MARYVNCNLCDSNDTRLLYHIDGFNIVRCNRCGLVYNNPQKEEKDLKDGARFLRRNLPQIVISNFNKA